MTVLTLDRIVSLPDYENFTRAFNGIGKAQAVALWNDGNGLWQLVQAVDALRSREAGTLARPWVDRAVELGVEEARFARASLRAAAGDKSGALEDLRDYVATFPSPPRLEEARALRLTLTTSNGDSPERLAHGKLAQDKPSEALAALGGSCRKGLPFDSLMAIGRVHEFMGNVTGALDCYGLAIGGSAAVRTERKQRAWERLSSAATALPVSELGRFRSSLEQALKVHVPLAAFSLARIAESENDWAQATMLVRAFVDGADADDPRLVEARALQARVGKVMEGEIEQGNRRSERIRVLVALLVVALLVGLFARRRYRQPISRALRSQPLLFPTICSSTEPAHWNCSLIPPPIAGMSHALFSSPNQHRPRSRASTNTSHRKRVASGCAYAPSHTSPSSAH